MPLGAPVGEVCNFHSKSDDLSASWLLGAEGETGEGGAASGPADRGLASPARPHPLSFTGETHMDRPPARSRAKGLMHRGRMRRTLRYTAVHRVAHRRARDKHRRDPAVYSCNASDASFTTNPHITVYCNGHLVYGTKP
jgi:hypothetical protein